MLLLGATVPGRFTEQHDIFFGIASSLNELVPQIRASWPGAKVHIDAWREVTRVDDHMIRVVSSEHDTRIGMHRLFFINLGGYKEDAFDEFHYKVLSVAMDKGEAIRNSKQTAFYKHMGYDKATSHVDDKYGVDVDDIYAIHDILSVETKKMYSLEIIAGQDSPPDKINLGYFKLDKLDNL